MIRAVPQDLDRSRAEEGAIMAPGASAVAAPGGGRLVAARWPAFLRVFVEPDVFSLHENLWPGGRYR